MKNLSDRINEKKRFYNNNPDSLLALSGVLMTAIPLVVLVVSAFAVSIFQHLVNSQRAVSAVLIIMNTITSIAMIVYVPQYCRGWWLTSRKSVNEEETVNNIIQVIISMIFPACTILILFITMDFTSHVSSGGTVLSMEQMFAIFLPYMKIGPLYFA